MTAIKDKGANDMMVAARIALLLDHYFFGRLAMHLKLVEQPSIKTLAVDGKHLFYSPDFVRSLSADLRKSGFVHEIMHCVQEHFLRRNGREHKRWNYAGDYVINPIIKDAGFKLGGDWLYDDQYRDMSTEHVYELLKQKGEGDEGSPDAGEAGGAFDEVMDGAVSAGDAAEQAMDWEIAVSQAATMAKQHGNLPKGMERFLKDLEAPQVPWREVLQNFVTEVSRTDYSWMRANRRYVAHGVYLPSLHTQTMGPMVTGIDTSGSIDDVVLTAFGTEVAAAFHTARPSRLVNIYCDAAVAHVDEVEQGDLLPPFKAHGGGGTDFRPPFDWVDEHEVKPACLIYLTDGYGPFPDEPPEYPVLWVMTTDVVPPWGEHVRIRV